MHNDILQQIYKTSLGLMTDMYQMTMAYGYWKSGKHEEEAVFNLFFRTTPFKGGYVVCAGLANVIEYLNHLSFTAEDIAYLATLTDQKGHHLFETEFLNYLKNMRFACDVDAIPEGTVVFAQEPLIRIKGPLLQCQILETSLLNIINFQTLIATKSSRICHATLGEPVLEFGLRRAQGPDGGISASRAAYIGGCSATSNLLAGKLYNIPVQGTQAHSWIMSFPSELESFEAYATAFPDNCVFLVDTYNTLEGVKHAIEIGLKLKKFDHKLLGVRLDSGDLAYLSIEARKLLDAAGFQDTFIVGSNDLDEHIIASLKDQGAKINVWAVGTRIATAYDQPALDGVYKLTALREPTNDWSYKLKLSEQATKTTTPGILQVRRYFYNGQCLADAIYDEKIGITDSCTIIDPLDMTHQRKIVTGTPYRDLLEPVFRKGKCVYSIPHLSETRLKTLHELQQFHPTIRRFLNPHIYPVGLEKQLYDLKTKLILIARGIHL